MQFGSIPALLIALAHWVDWRYEERDGKRTKIPYCAATGLRASTTDPSTWSVYESAAAAAPRYDGIGFVFSKEDDLVGVDLDDCRDPETAEIAEWALAIVRSLDSYTEITPSGRGLHILCRGKLPPGGRRKGKIEIYEDGRYFTITGDRLREGSEAIEERQEELTALHSSLFPAPVSAPRPNGAVASQSPRGDWEIVDQVRKNPKYDALWRGDISAYPSHSEADGALCNQIAWFAGPDRQAVDRLFRQSGLYREKWDAVHGAQTYGAMTVGLVLDGRAASDFYQWKPPSVASVAGRSEKTVTGEVKGPPSLAPEAYYGLPGKVMRAIAPHTESAPAGVLGSFLTAGGCLIGPGPHVYRDGQRHATNEFGLIVGKTSEGRKGSATRRVNEVFQCLSDSNSTTIDHVDMRAGRGGIAWQSLILRGLGSGESLVAALAEEQESGVLDPRRLVFESEFSRCLKVMSREGSTLSETLRSAWDSEPLHSRTKGKLLRADAAHVSILAHITPADLRERMAQADLFNGFANRFLWFTTHRSQSLPFGGGDVAMAGIVLRMHEALAFTRGLSRLEFDEDAAWIWEHGGIYDLLCQGSPGLLGAVTDRAAAHVTRIALQYAVWDCSRSIEVAHLLAGLAVWEHSAATCAELFGQSSGDSYADAILELAQEASPGWLTRKEIRDLFSRHAAPGRIPAALALLEDKKQIERRKQDTAGRSAEIILFLDGATCDRSDRSPLNIARGHAKERGYATEATEG